MGFVIAEEAIVEVGREHFTFGRNGLRPRRAPLSRCRRRHRGSANRRGGPEPPKPRDRRRVEQRAEMFRASRLKLRGLVGRAVDGHHARRRRETCNPIPAVIRHAARSRRDPGRSHGACPECCLLRAGLSQRYSEPDDFVPALHSREIRVVLFRDGSRVPFGPVRVEVPRRHPPLIVGRRPLSNTHVSFAQQWGRAGVGAHGTAAHSRGTPAPRGWEPVHVLGARHLVGAEPRHVDAPRCKQLHAVALDTPRATSGRPADRTSALVDHDRWSARNRRQDPRRGRQESRPRQRRPCPVEGVDSAAAINARPAGDRNTRAPRTVRRDVHVVGPRQDLRVKALHVVALVERVDDGLPVRVDDRRAIAAEPHALEAIRREEGRERFEELREWLGVRVEVHEDEPPKHSARTGPRVTSSVRSVKSARSGTCTRRPSSAYVHPWYGHRMQASSRTRAVASCVPRCGTCCEADRASSPRTISTRSSPIVYSTYHRDRRVPPRGTRPATPATTAARTRARRTQRSYSAAGRAPSARTRMCSSSVMPESMVGPAFNLAGSVRMCP